MGHHMFIKYDLHNINTLQVQTGTLQSSIQWHTQDFVMGGRSKTHSIYKIII